MTRDFDGAKIKKELERLIKKADEATTVPARDNALVKIIVFWNDHRARIKFAIWEDGDLAQPDVIEAWKEKGNQ